MNGPVNLDSQRSNKTTHSSDATPLSQTKLKIALLGYRSHPFVGGQGIYIKYLSRALTKLGHTVHVYSGQPYPELDDEVELIKVPSLNLYESPNHMRALRWRHLLSWTDFYEWLTMATGGFGEPYTFGRRVYKLIRNSDYDIIHDNQSLCSSLIKLQKNGHKVISTIHHPIHRDRELAIAEAPNKGMRILIKRWYSFLRMQERVANELNHVVTVSKQSQADIGHYFLRPRGKTHVIFNGIDTELFSPQKELNKEALSLLTTSSSDQALKGLRGLLFALSELRKTIPQIKLNIIGELKSGGANQKLIEELNLASHIHFHSNLSNEQLVDLYNEATIVICPSLYEGFGLPAAEALACGTAVISSDGGALPEVVGDAGLIYPAGNSDALTKSVLRLLENGSLRKALEEKGRARALEVFSWDRVAQQLNTYYQGLVTN